MLRNEPDLARATDYDGGPISPVELLPEPSPDPARTFLNKVFDQEFVTFLGKDRRIKTLFRLIRAGLWKPSDLARKLKRRVRTVDNLLKRLKRKLARFLAARSSAEFRNTSKGVCAHRIANQSLAIAAKKIITPDGGKRLSRLHILVER